MLLDQPAHAVAAFAIALRACHAKGIELADQVTEDDRTVAGHHKQLGAGIPIRRPSLTAGLGSAREYSLAGGTEAAPVLDQATSNAFLVVYKLVAEPGHVVGAGLLLGLTSTEDSCALAVGSAASSSPAAIPESGAPKCAMAAKTQGCSSRCGIVGSILPILRADVIESLFVYSPSMRR
jgi:hypothetical protein